MYTLVIILIILASLLMIAIVLVQESKGGGLSSQFSASNSIMGVRKTTDFVEKATWTLAGTMVALSIVCAYIAPAKEGTQSVLERTATETQTTNPNTTPGFGTPQAAPAQGNNAATAGQNNAPAAAPAQNQAPQAPAK